MKAILTLAAAATLAFLHEVAAYDNGIAELAKPPMGWSTWCTNDLCGIPDRCSEYEVRNKVDAMVANGMRDMGYKWLLLDDCWSHTERDENGELQPSPKLFPSGMKALADYIHANGMYLGLYSCVGTETCKKHRPGSYGHYEQDAQTFANWGADMVKADYCYKPANESGRDLYTQYSKALNATGKPILFAMCQWGVDDVQEWAPEIAQMYRIQMDHIPFWSWAEPLPQAAGEGFGQGTKEIIDYMATLSPSKYNQPHAWMDPDFLETLFEPLGHEYPPMNFTNSRTEMTFWSLWSAPLLMATDPDNLSEEKKSIIMNEEVIAVNQDSFVYSGERIRNDAEPDSPSKGGGQVWTRPMSDGSTVVVLYNSGNANSVQVSVSWSELGFEASQKMTVRDIWQKSDIGVFTDSIGSVLDAHDVAFLKLSPQA